MRIYYIEVNLICMIILTLFQIQLRGMKTSSTDQRILKLLIWGTTVFCFSDMMAGVFRGAMFPGARALIEVSNLLYFEAVVWVSFLWSEYVDVRLVKDYSRNRPYRWLGALPLLFFTLVALTNPYTHILFRINPENLYERNIGVYLHWVIVWGYFLVPSIRALRTYMQETSRLRKQETAPLLYFTVAPVISSIIQMAFYGVTSTQAGVTISVVMICLTGQDTQILTDTLTGVNNRRGFEYHLAGCMQRSPEAVYMLMMLDVDHFKYINDKFGHMVGDFVLQGIAEALKQASAIPCRTKSPTICPNLSLIYLKWSTSSIISI